MTPPPMATRSARESEHSQVLENREEPRLQGVLATEWDGRVIDPGQQLRLEVVATMLRLCDVAAVVTLLLVGFLISNIGRMSSGFQDFLEVRLTVRNLLLLLGFAVAGRGIAELLELYRPARLQSDHRYWWRVSVAAAGVAAVALAFPIISKTQAFDFVAVAIFWVSLTGAMLALRWVFRAALHRRPLPVRHVIIVGTGPRAARLHRSLSSAGADTYRVLGAVDVDGAHASPELAGCRLGDLGDLEVLLMRRPVDEVFIALPAKSHYQEIQNAIDVCERGGVRARYLTDVFRHRRKGHGPQVGSPDSLALVPNGPAPDDPGLLVKRGIDIIGAAAGLVFSLPVIALAALALRLSGAGPVFFAQERYGLNKRRFKMYKLRTMVVGAEACQESLEDMNEASGPVFKIRNDPRITRLGRVLRRFSIDELPQFLNVLRGDMSLVGPRPLPLRDVSRFTEPQLMRRFSMPPGLTCLWQIGGRSEVTFNEWIRLDLEYIDNWSVSLDLWIILRTIPTVIRGVGAA